MVMAVQRDNRRGCELVEFYQDAGGHQVRVGTKVEIWAGGRAVGWGEVMKLLPERRVLIERPDRDDSYPCDVETDSGEIYVDDWSPQVRELMAARERRLWQPAEVDSWRIAGGGEVRVGTKLEDWDGTAKDDEDRDWGEVTQLLTGRTSGCLLVRRRRRHRFLTSTT